jgi:adenine-specific DNA-methyltransferase
MPVLQFKGKTAVESYHYTVPHHTLDFDKKLSLLPKGEKPGLDGNLILEGDNLLALKALLPTHAGRVKCIYIDPPYNTGSEAWVYNDNLTQPQFKEWIGEVVGKEGEDACRHDKWCCMMYPRLALLKEMLREDGVLFVSIGDDEVAHLRLLLDEVFGESNFVAHVVWQKRYVSNVTAQLLSDMHDHILVFARRRDAIAVKKIARDEEQLEDYKNPDEDPRGDWRAQDLSASKPYKAGVFTIVGPTGKQFSPPPGRYWRCNEEQYKKWLGDNRIWFGKSGEGRPMLKAFLSETTEGITPNTWWSYTFAGHNKEATLELKAIFDGESPFDTPKPVKLVRRMLELFSDTDSIVLDSFAGSGTTAHAVLELNAEDQGKRTFVLVQQPHDTKQQEADKVNLCNQVTAQRVRRIMQGYRRPNGDGTQVPGLGGSFTYARIGRRLFGEYRDLGDTFPAYDELAKYIFDTETSRDFDAAAVNRKTGRIGENQGTAYYLLYTDDPKSEIALDTVWLKDVAAKEKCRKLVVYCEKLWLHRNDLLRWQEETQHDVRPMLVPFNLK